MRTHHRSASPFEERIRFSRAVRIGTRIIVSGTAPIAPDGTTVEGDAHTQARRCFQIIVEALEALQASSKDVVRTRMFLVDPADHELVGRAHAEFFGDVCPASTMIAGAVLLDARWRVEIEAEAELDRIDAHEVLAREADHLTG